MGILNIYYAALAGKERAGNRLSVVSCPYIPPESALHDDMSH